MKKSYVLGVLVIAVLAQAFLASAQMYQMDFNNTPSTNTISSSTLIVKVLKYEPYPVSAGDWFDLWIKVQNIGQYDAPNARFELQPAYPFSSNDSLIRDYGLLPGTLNAYKFGMTGDANEVILKYRVKTADNAPEGTSNLRFASSTDYKNPSMGSVGIDLPIEIGKTKTDFDVVMQDSSAQGISFAISNIGENAATAVTVTLEPQDFSNFTGRNITGARNFTRENYPGRTSANVTGLTVPMSSIIGNLEKGDFTTVTFQATLNSNIARIKIDYTDIAGVRNSVEKTVPVTSVQRTAASTTAANAARKTTTSLPSYIYIVIGIILGIMGLIVYNKISKKK